MIKQNQTYKPYPAYKDSGVEWIGEIPERWRHIRLKQLVSVKITDGPHETPQFIDDGVPFLSAEGIVGNQIDFSRIRGFISQDQADIYSMKCKPLVNDILFCKSGSTTGKSAIVKCNTHFSIWSPLALIRVNNNKFYHYFVYHFMQSRNFKVQVELFWSFGTQPNIGMNVLENLFISFPPLQEQTAIATFLDKKTAQIDTLIQKKKRLNELLKEEREAIINHAVTKGLPAASAAQDPNPKMKDSGVEWIGEIPEGWEVKRTKYLFSLITEPAPKGNKERLLSIYTHIGVRPRKDLEQKGNKSSTTDNYWIVKKNDLIVNKLLAWMGAIGMSDYSGVTSPAYDILRAKKSVYAEYYHYLFRTDIAKAEFKKYSRGIMEMRLRLYFDEFGKIFNPLPPYNEQIAIVNYIKRKTSQIDKTSSNNEKEIELLTEYRAALISEAVTGKIDIRGLV